MKPLRPDHGKKLPELSEEDLQKLLADAPAPEPRWYERPPEPGEQSEPVVEEAAPSTTAAPLNPKEGLRPYVDTTGFTILPNWFQKHCIPVFSHRGLRVMLAFYRRAAKDGKVVVSQVTLANETGLDRRDLQRTLDRLEQTTVIEVERPGTFGRSTQYRLTPVDRVNLRLATRKKIWTK